MTQGMVADSPSVEGARPFVVDLADELALDPALTGGKAAALARVRPPDSTPCPASCSPPRSATRSTAAPTSPAPGGAGRLRARRRQRRALVARSSSVVEDTAESSMAGQFESVIGIHGFDAFVTAVTAVLDSRQRAGAADQPIAVLVQPLIEPRFGGVMFGIDPVSGRTDRRVVTAVHGGPEPLVSGEVDGSRYVLEPTSAKVIEFAANDGPELPTADLRRLVALSASVATVSSAARRTSSGPSARTRSSGCSSPARSPPRSEGHRGARSTARARWRRPSPSRYRAGARPLGPPAAGGRARGRAPGRRGHAGAMSRPARWWSASTAMWPSTCGWPARSRRSGRPAPAQPGPRRP